MTPKLAEMLLFAVATDSAIVYSQMQMRNTLTCLSRLSQNRIPRSPTLVNPATDWKKSFMQLPAWFKYVACVSAPNHFSLMLYVVINYNDVTFTTCSHE